MSVYAGVLLIFLVIVGSLLLGFLVGVGFDVLTLRLARYCGIAVEPEDIPWLTAWRRCLARWRREGIDRG